MVVLPNFVQYQCMINATSLYYCNKYRMCSTAVHIHASMQHVASSWNLHAVGYLYSKQTIAAEISSFGRHPLMISCFKCKNENICAC